MEIKNEGKGKIKTFLAERKPEPVKVFQFTKEMLPNKFDKNKLDIRKRISGFEEITSYLEVCSFNSNISFEIYKNRIKLLIYIRGGADSFEVGDYIGEQEGNYFVIKKDIFEKDWVKK